MVSVDDILNELRLAQDQWHASFDEPVSVRNRLMTLVQDVETSLSRTAEGRGALEQAAEHDPDPAMRLGASATVEQWNPNRAAHALEALIRDLGGTVRRPMTMSCALSQPAGHVLKSAALRLYNLDRHQRIPPTAHCGTDSSPRNPSPVVSSGLLRAAETVHALAMNGGLDHAFEVAGDRFPDAISALKAAGALEAGELLGVALATLCGDRPIPADIGARTAILESLQSDGVAALDELSREFTDIDVMAYLEAATGR